MDYLKDSVFIATFAEKPVAMFALLNHEFHNDLLRAPGAINLPHVLELMYVYVEKDYRGLGCGRQIIDDGSCVRTPIWLHKLNPVNHLIAMYRA